jgi:amidase
LLTAPQTSVLKSDPCAVISIFKSCSLLTDRELEITDVTDCITLLEKLHAKEYTALEVTVAFCKRATIAQQLINPLMDVDFDAALKRAKELDDHLGSTGDVVGPLHGLPISLKVSLED